MINNWTLFGNAAGGGGAASIPTYLQDVFLDVTNAPSNNTGFTSTASTNPLNANFANDDIPRYEAKTYYIKDFVLIQDRSQWVNNEPTYKIIWNTSEQTAPLVGYAWGDIDLPTGTFRKIGDGVAVSGVVRNVSFIVRPNQAATATAQIKVDGSNLTTIDFSNSIALANGYAQPVISASNQTYNIHDYRITALQTNTLSVVGVVVYFENSNASIDCFPGSTYVNKTKVTTTSGSSFGLPALGSSLGGKNLIYKTSAGAYSVSSQGASMVNSIGIGLVNTNLVLVNTGDGSKFNIGDGFLIDGVTAYLGQISNVSTDTLTVSPTLPIGVSGLCYRTWSAGPTYSINASLMALKYSIDFSQTPISGSTGAVSYISQDQKWSIWGENFGPQVVDQYPALTFYGATYGSINVAGFFSAAEIEYCGSGINHATFLVNGINSWSISEGQTGTIKKTVFTSAGPQWNAFRMLVGSSFGTSLAITKINLYQNQRNIGQSFGQLVEFDSLQSYVPRSSGATALSLGMYQRTYADRLYFYGGASAWVRGVTVGAAGAVQYGTGTAGSKVRFDFYGKEFALIGTIGGGYTFSIDGGFTTTAFNTPLSAPSLGFHSLVYEHRSGSSSLIQAIDFRRPIGEFNSLQNTAPISGSSARTGQLEFDLYGPYSLAGQSQTGAIYQVVPRNIAVTGVEMYVVGAGSTGISQVDILYNYLNGGFTSIFFTAPAANTNLGSNYISTNAVLNNYPFYLNAGSILRFDVQSAQVGGNGLLTRLNYQEI